MNKPTIRKKNFYILSVLILPAVLSLLACMVAMLIANNAVLFMLVASVIFYPFYAPVALVWAVLLNKADSQNRVMLMLFLPAVFAVVLWIWLHASTLLFTMVVGYTNIALFFALLFIGKRLGLIISDDDVEHQTS